MKNSRFLFGSSSPLLPLLFTLATACGPSDEEPKPTNPWHGRTYVLDITLVNWAEPRGVGRDIDAYVPNFLIHVDEDAPDAFRVTMGTAHVDGSQDTCNMTRQLDATADPPATVIGPSDFPLFVTRETEIGGETYKIAVEASAYNLTITNVLPDGDPPSDIGEFVATMDFRELYPLVLGLPVRNPDTVCDAFAAEFPDHPCEPCPYDQEPYCLTVKAVDLFATPYDGEITPIDAVDPACIPPPIPEMP